MEDNKIYVFLSHSHHDYEKVRKVRDLLEDKGFRPLMFFLKCLEKKEYKDLMKTLIKDEIDSRQRFILCKSKNADESDWVDFEIKYIEETKRPYEIVDLNAPEDKWEYAIKRFRIRSTVFLSYPTSLINLMKETNVQLKKRDFRTFFDVEDLTLGSDFQREISYQIRKASYEGYVLAFINEHFSKESFQYQEISLALDRNKLTLKNNVIPVWASQEMDYQTLRQTNRAAHYALGHFQGIDVCKMEIKEAAKEIVRQLTEIDIHNNQQKISYE